MHISQLLLPEKGERYDTVPLWSINHDYEEKGCGNAKDEVHNQEFELCVNS